MTFVPVKSAEQQAALMLHTARDLPIRQRTMLANAIRGHAAGFRVCAPQGQGQGKVEALLKRVAEDAAIPALARDILELYRRQLEALEERIEMIERRPPGRRWTPARRPG
jgi:transposase